MNKYHQEILREIKNYSGNETKHGWNDNYLGNKHFYYNLSNPLKREITKSFIKHNKAISLSDFIDLLNSLYKGNSYEEKTIAGYLLWYLPKFRRQLNPELLDRWLNQLNGWAEIAATCQSNFTAEELINSWKSWKQLITKLSKDKNNNKRRASLVLLTGVVSKSEDKRLSDLAFEIIERLKLEKDILITKAISWLLRDLIKNHRRKVEDYLNNNETSLPKIAIRETRSKLLR